MTQTDIDNGDLSNIPAATKTYSDSTVAPYVVIEFSATGTPRIVTPADPFPTTDATAQGKLDTLITSLVSLLTELEAKTEPANTQVTSPTAWPEKTYTASLGNTATSSQTTARKLGGWVFGNASASSSAYIKIYDKATAATSSDTPIIKIALGPGATANVELTRGIPITNGITVRATTAVADNSTAGPTTNDAFGTFFWST